ncbi:MAG TPA: hypothetical protein VFT99_07840 [Roseiflexaceae bacterium]|nr:hypothetical protein [Roseiflexaceae bacterium]
MKHYRILMPLVLAAFLAGCTSAATQQTPAAVATLAPTSGAPTAVPTAAPATEPTAAPTAVPVAEPTAAPAANTVDGGVTEQGYHFLGRADAPATIVMYSDVF